MRWWLLLGWLLSWTALPIEAAGLIVRLTDGHGRAVSDAVVTLTPALPPAASSPPPPVIHIVDQQDETFTPYVQFLHPGDKVVFRNSDTTRHHVYSFAAIKKFDFVLKPGQSSPAMELDQPGIAAVGCNIHDHMITYLVVSAAPLMAMSDHGGAASFHRLKPGRYTAQIWHPQLYPGQASPSQPVDIIGKDDDARLSFTLSLIPDPRVPMDRTHPDY